MLKSRHYRYNDVRLFLLLIPVIAAINYHLTYTNIQLNWFLVFTFLIDVQQGYVGWLCSRAVILYLDKVYPYRDHTTKRILLQTVTSSVAGVVAIILQTMAMNYLFTDHPIPLNFFTIDVVIISIWFLVLNGIYVGLHYYTEWKNSEEARENEKMIRSEGFRVKAGKRDLSISFAEIAGFTIENEYAALVTMEAKNYYLDESLDAVEEKLPGEFFFRLNRQFIVHRQIISGFERAENGKINALVNAPQQFPKAISVSRLKAPSFKTWFQPG